MLMVQLVAPPGWQHGCAALQEVPVLPPMCTAAAGCRNRGTCLTSCYPLVVNGCCCGPRLSGLRVQAAISGTTLHGADGCAPVWMGG
jgi:hypothetical protein